MQLTARENVEFFAGLYGLSGIALQHATDSALEFVGLADRANDRAGTYSGGMQRRLNIACAIAHGPEMVLFDEPTVGVDPQSRNQIFDNIEALKKRGVTILYTTHYMEEAARLCDRVAIMDAGRVLALDTVDALIAAHGGKSRVEAEFDGDIPESLRAKGDVEDGKLTLRTDKPLELLSLVAGSGVPMRTLNLHRPTLEDVFLNLTGRKLRD